MAIALSTHGNYAASWGDRSGEWRQTIEEAVRDLREWVSVFSGDVDL
jgi:hypothetical protein